MSWGHMRAPISRLLLRPGKRHSVVYPLVPGLNRRLHGSTVLHDLAETVTSPEPASLKPQPSLLGQLQQRGLVESVTGPQGGLDTFIQMKQRVVYAGVDPTASSLHVGHLLPLLNLLHFYLHGHSSIALVGGATASVGDPSGRTKERDEQKSTEIKSAFKSIWDQLDKFFTNGEAYALERGYSKVNFGKRRLKTNSDWLNELSIVGFLQTVGRNVRVGQMLARESVKTRMTSNQGINFAEFTYQLLQSYDFWHLYSNFGCRIQIGGNDQYGNITAGIDLITRLRKSLEAESPSPPSRPVPRPANDTADRPPPFDLAYGLTVPLLTTPSGEKFGKSAGNAVWLDGNLTSPFDLYQFFARLPDEVVAPYLRSFTLLPLEEITKIVNKHMEAPHLRRGQHTLAMEVLHLVHGKGAARQAEVATELLFNPYHEAGDFGADPSSDSGVSPSYTAEDIIRTFENDKNNFVKIARGMVVGDYLTKVAKTVGLVKTRNESEALVKQGGLYVGAGKEMKKVKSGKERLEEETLLEGRVLFLRMGKARFVVCQVVE